MKRWTTNLVAGTAWLFLTASQCPQAAERIVIVGRGVRLMDLDYGAVGNVLARRTYTVFGGTAARSIGLIVNRRRVSAANPVLLRSSDGTVVATLTTPDAGTTEPVIRIPGNVAMMEANWNGAAPVPSVSLRQVDIATTSASTALSTLPLDGAFQMSLNTPVELFFGPVPTTYYLWIDGVGASTVDVVLDGPGRVHVSDPVGGRIVLDGSGAPVGPQPLDVIDRGTGGVATFATVTPQRDTLLLTVSNLATGDAGHARVTVNAVLDRFPLTVWFNTAVPPGAPPAFDGRSAASITTTMTSIANETSKSLYQATGGRVRLGPLTVLVGPNQPTGRFDVRVESGDTPLTSHVYGFQDMPVVIELDADWWYKSIRQCGEILAHELWHYRYGLPDEYHPPLPPPSACINCCPASMMSEESTRGDELCWRGNHNPFGDPLLATRTTSPDTGPNASMWALFAFRRGIAAPTSSPVRVLRGSVLSGGSAVVFP